MPELPEVETITKALKKVIVNKKIQDVFLGKKNLRIPYPKNFRKNILGKKFGIPFRRAKYCILPISNNNKIILHLGMSGQIRILNRKFNIEKHDHVIFHLNDGLKIKYSDPRRFGFITLSEKETNEIDFLKNIGPEPNSFAFNENYLLKKINNKNKAIKNILMDQKIVAGLGNIYVNEALHMAKVSPQKPGSSINLHKAKLIINSIKFIIQNAIDRGGTTLRDHIQPDGKLGYFSNELRVYGKENKPCYYCRSLIKVIKQSGRTTFYCKKCQN